ncbi:restriction endonuclease [Chryseobacterium sp. KCF3-3]|uniref:restriction endonuclease n=1 Tax=Chryseobacterium sp. KCF3-3 TaxID=3231511 RepID=UPI0038B37F36
MGAIIWSLQNCINSILDVVIIKTGLVITEEYLIELLKEEFPNSHFDRYEESADVGIRVRSEDFDMYCREIRKKLGELENTIPLFVQDVEKCVEWMEQEIDYMGCVRQIMSLAAEKYNPDDPQLIDTTFIFEKLIEDGKYPLEVIEQAFKDIIHQQQMSNNITPTEEILWDGGVSLEDLFKKEHIPINENEFIDQKFINFLQANPKELEAMHWRNFERLTAEFFNRQGYEIELGPGTNDGGVDVRVFNKEDKTKPYIIIQCKRHKESNEVKIETVKSFYTDVAFEEAGRGLIATTSKIAAGGKKVVSIRKYPLQFAENKEIIDWVDRMCKRIV